MSAPRDLPGFYYDTEKKKYFRIQANHIAPAGAKHSVAAVRTERREAKRRRVTEAQNERISRSTVRRPGIFTHALSTTSLYNELGLSHPSARQSAQASLLCTHLRRCATLDLGSCHACGRRNKCFDFSPLAGGEIACLSGDAGAVLSVQCPSAKRREVKLGGLASEGTSLAASQDGWVVATASIPHGANVAIADLRGGYELAAAVMLTLGGKETEVLASCVQGANAVVAGSAEQRGGAWVLDCYSARVRRRISTPALRSADWLSRDVVVLGARTGKVLLWDTRSQGIASRFKHTGEARQVAACRGNSVWVAGLGGVARYDTRMDKEPVVRLAEDRWQPRVQMCLWEAGGVLALAGSKGDIVLYQERDGSRLGTVAERQIWADDAEAGIHPIGRIRVNEDPEGNMGLWYARGERLYHYSL